jgi:DNA helicase TIP49 (TBP-interacting protein)
MGIQRATEMNKQVTLHGPSLQSQQLSDHSIYSEGEWEKITEQWRQEYDKYIKKHVDEQTSNLQLLPRN